MPTPITFTLTDVGLAAALDAVANGVTLSLIEVGVGTGKYTPTAAITALTSETMRSPLSGGDIEPNSGTLRFSAAIESVATVEIFEIGLYTAGGVLFAVASVTGSVPLFLLSANVTVIQSFGMVVSQIPAGSLTVTTDPNAPLALALMTQHVAAANPHPQYAMKGAFDGHVTEYEEHVEQNTIEHNNLLTLISAAIVQSGISLDQAVASLSAALLQHRQASNPHPQYLLASTFGVNLLMTATVSTPLDAANRVFGWNGENGDTDFPIRSIRWWNRHAETIRFQPFRSYGQFLLHCNFQPQGDGYLEIKTFDQNGVELSLTVLMNISRAAYNVYEPAIDYVFELPANGYAEIHYSMYVWNKHYGSFDGSIYVNDRVKRFTPVGYTSNVNAANTNSTGSTTEASDYSVFPAYEWFYFDTASQTYLQLSAVSTLALPESKEPHFHRNVLLPNANDDLWVWVQVGLQTVAEDYAAVDTQVLRAGADAAGVTIVQIPVSMRTIATPDNETLVYTLAYYSSAVLDSELTVPSGSLNGEHLIYVNRS
jgi:hypothetical protein